MLNSDNTLSADEQREYQAAAWELPEDSTWPEIKAHVLKQGRGMVFVDPDDWVDLMTDLYGSEIFDSDDE